MWFPCDLEAQSKGPTGNTRISVETELGNDANKQIGERQSEETPSEIRRVVTNALANTSAEQKQWGVRFPATCATTETQPIQ